MAVTAGRERELVTHLRALATSTGVPTEVHPMQSPVWISPVHTLPQRRVVVATPARSQVDRVGGLVWWVGWLFVYVAAGL